MASHFLVSRTQCSSEHHAPSHACHVEGAPAMKQHSALCDALVAHGATVEKLPFIHGARGSVLTRDVGVLTSDRHGRRALVASPRDEGRRSEMALRARTLSRLGFSIDHAVSPFEGGDVVMLPGKGGAFLGHGFRSSKDAAPELERFLGTRVTTLQLADPRIHHLDMALAVLDDGTALVCQEALTADAMRALAFAKGIGEMILVPLEDALASGLDLIQIGRSVLGPMTSRTVVDHLEEMGLRSVRVQLDPFQRMGITARSLVAEVHNLEQTTQSARPVPGIQSAPRAALKN